jgi:Fur family transcriptional regulator, ferric uptake regulator
MEAAKVHSGVLAGVLAEAGVRPTRSRLTVLEALERSANAVSAQELFVALRGRPGAPGLATIYRTLAALAEVGVVETFREGEEALFRRCGDAHHHHLVCNGCGLVEEIESEEVEAWVARVSRRRSFTVTAHRADIFGLCASCR